ncbi:hypothetical protein STEG23_017856 [Scotinomys teguina]
MEPAPGSDRRSPPGPGVPRPPPRGHSPSTAAPAPSPAPASFSVQSDEERQPRISESGQFSDGLEDRGLLESSTRLKPHEAQNYRKKALWVSWFSIIVTLALAVAAFKRRGMRKKWREITESFTLISMQGEFSGTVLSESSPQFVSIANPHCGFYT